MIKKQMKQRRKKKKKKDEDKGTDGEAPYLFRGSFFWQKQNARYGEKHRADVKKKVPKKKIRKRKKNT